MNYFCFQEVLHNVINENKNEFDEKALEEYCHIIADYMDRNDVERCYFGIMVGTVDPIKVFNTNNDKPFCNFLVQMEHEFGSSLDINNYSIDFVDITSFCNSKVSCIKLSSMDDSYSANYYFCKIERRNKMFCG
jgi:hypothetical protein